jgi:N-acetyl-gamma-glutamyl-phosphate reductase
VAVLGASGYAGALCAELVHHHPRLELTHATARSDVGAHLSQLYPRYRCNVELTEYDPAVIEAEADAALVAYPHGAAMPVVAELLERGLKVVDLSADFRLERSRYESYYQPHEAAELLDDAVYGLPEFTRHDVRDAQLVANPGCYPTAALLALMPLRGQIADAVVDAKSGVSGAGRAATDKTHFVSVVENFSPYGVERHRHRAELEQYLADDPRHLGAEGSSALTPGGAVPVTFVPHLLPLDQGLLASCYVKPRAPISRDELRTLFDNAYAGEPFVHVVDAPPGVRDVRDGNECHIHATVEGGGDRVLVFSAIDNLWKGAAGQAVQNLNLMLGLSEAEGLVNVHA